MHLRLFRTQSAPKLLPVAFFWSPLASQISYKSLKGPSKKQQKNNAIFVAPRTSKLPRNGLKIDVIFLMFFILFASLHAYCFQMAPERQKYNFFFKIVPPGTTFIHLRLHFLTIVLTLFLCPLSLFDEKQITRKIEKWKQNYTDCEYSTNCFGVRRCHASGVFNYIYIYIYICIHKYIHQKLIELVLKYYTMCSVT